MTDIRAKLADALAEHSQADEWGYDVEECRCGETFTGTYAEHLADVLLALEGVAVVPLLELDGDEVAIQGEMVVSRLDPGNEGVWMTSDAARKHAAALLDAANDAEVDR